MTITGLRRVLLSISTLLSFSHAQLAFNTSNFVGAFAAGSGVLESLRPALAPDFDFSPSDVFDQRNGPGQYHTGDLTFRYRTSSNGTWSEGNTAALRMNVSSSQTSGLLDTQLNAALPGLPSGLSIERRWFEVDGDLALEFVFNNTGSSQLELGSVGMAIEFNLSLIHI